ncbi:hypothetical protein [Pseudoflavitalea rhizosphaerae]|uniref:hypothetical protein n=1 Tax=Pseudoflavitalea rhizosphaerae TaxID=1884793 RepID=UPI000F8D9C53|nr:hypothetical protein [Pseudoflavitalea rhizosphaerae]
MEESKRNLLTDHLDETLQGRRIPEAEELIRQQPEALEEWNYQNLAVDAIRYEGLVQQVAAVKEQFLADTRKAPVFSMKKILRVSAAIIVLLGAAAVLKYASVNSKHFFKDHYAAYELPVKRGEGVPSGQDLVRAYDHKNWKEVIRLYEHLQVKNNQSIFLAGIAEMELHNYDAAIRKFEGVLNNAGDRDYEDETNYYLALALLANDQPAEAIAIFEKIETNPGHPYAERVKGFSELDLNILKRKAGSRKQ